MDDISSHELQAVIADFLELGHVANIVAMVRQDPSCLPLTGALLQDERFMVRMGVAVLFEELAPLLPAAVLDRAVPSLHGLAKHPASLCQG